MSVTINGQEIPSNSLHTISLSEYGIAHLSGETVNEDDSKTVRMILDSLKEGDRIKFDVEDKDSRIFHGAGFISNISIEEQGAGTSRGIRYWFTLEHSRKRKRLSSSM
jgi:hypothetical protein